MITVTHCAPERKRIAAPLIYAFLSSIKLIDCPLFRDQRPWQRRDTNKTAGRGYSCFRRHRISGCTKPRQCSECGGRHHKMLNCLTNGRSSATSSAHDAQTYLSSIQHRPVSHLKHMAHLRTWTSSGCLYIPLGQASARVKQDIPRFLLLMGTVQ